LNNLPTLLALAISAAQSAAREILDVYHSGDFQAELKGDNSPLTIADKRAHAVIAEVLKESELPILSEEGKSVSYEERRNWKHFWLVDPLDGTKEFIKRNGEFTVNIALMHHTAPVFGVVNVPVENVTYYGGKGIAAFKRRGDQVDTLCSQVRPDLMKEGIQVVASRSHMSEETERFIAKLKNPTLLSKGSSLKFMLIAEGLADIYPRFGPTMEWDTAAAHAILQGIGRDITTVDGLAFNYNKPELLNPSFLVC
jgi:3'(2'), 5'-bisphosphate nucleotidase